MIKRIASGVLLILALCVAVSSYQTARLDNPASAALVDETSALLAYDLYDVVATQGVAKPGPVPFFVLKNNFNGPAEVAVDITDSPRNLNVHLPNGRIVLIPGRQKDIAGVIMAQCPPGSYEVAFDVVARTQEANVRLHIRQTIVVKPPVRPILNEAPAIATQTP